MTYADYVTLWREYALCAGSRRMPLPAIPADTELWEQWLRYAEKKGRKEESKKDKKERKRARERSADPADAPGEAPDVQALRPGPSPCMSVESSDADPPEALQASGLKAEPGDAA